MQKESRRKKTILITGASSGIGLATAEAFAARASLANPVELLLLARRQERLADLQAKWKEQPGLETHAIALDVRDFSAVESFAAKYSEIISRLDILVNNAGLAAGRDPIQTGDPADWNAMIDTNVKGLLYMTRIVAPHLIAKKSGHIVNIGSVAGHFVYPQGAVYCATKYGVRAINEGLRMDLLGTGVRVSSIDPGMVETEFSLVRFKGKKELAKAVYDGTTPLAPEDIAEAILWVTSLPAHVNVQDMVIMPTDQASVGHVYRRNARAP